MALILNIETSSSICSVCLAKDGEVIDSREDKKGNSHAKILTVFIEELFKDNHFSLNQLDAISVSAGPGSYTGLRIGVSVAKGLCYALSKPLIAIPTLLALAQGIKQKVKENDKNLLMPVMDARRQDIYSAIYDNLENEHFKPACVTLNDTLINMLEGYEKVIIGGNAMEKCKAFLPTKNITFIESVENNSQSMIFLSEKKFLNKEFEDIAYFEPDYLKEFGVH